jgi:hypothetical protein
MGIIAERIVEFAQPLIDQTDGSIEQMNKALGLAQVCFNLALISAEAREKQIREMQTSFGMDDEEFEDFRQTLLIPMLQRHKKMFPLMHNPELARSMSGFSIVEMPTKSTPPAEKRIAPEPYEPCPCGSGKKYRFCCHKKR